jgi:hypothetical protein
MGTIDQISWPFQGDVTLFDRVSRLGQLELN